MMGAILQPLRPLGDLIGIAVLGDVLLKLALWGSYTAHIFWVPGGRLPLSSSADTRCSAQAGLRRSLLSDRHCCG